MHPRKRPCESLNSPRHPREITMSHNPVIRKINNRLRKAIVRISGCIGIVIIPIGPFGNTWRNIRAPSNLLSQQESPKPSTSRVYSPTLEGWPIQRPTENIVTAVWMCLTYRCAHLVAHLVRLSSVCLSFGFIVARMIVGPGRYRRVSFAPVSGLRSDQTDVSAGPP